MSSSLPSSILRDGVWCSSCMGSVEGPDNHVRAEYVVVDNSDPEEPIAFTACMSCAEVAVTDADNPDVYAFLLPSAGNASAALGSGDFVNSR